MRTLTFACRSATRFSIRPMHFLNVGEEHTFALGIHALARHVVKTEHHVLRRNDDRVAVRRRQDVVRRHHQRARFQLRLERQRHVDGHLVAVEVGVERRTHERMQLDRLAFDQHGFERLNPEAMQGRCAVQQHRMLADDLLEDVPHFRSFAFHQALGGLDGRGSPRSWSFEKMNGLNSSSAIFFGRPH